MTNSTVLLGLLIAIVLGFLLTWWLIKTFASMSKREKDIYENELHEQNICPFDQNFCSILGKSMFKGYVTKVCQNCSRYKNSKP
jgi:hypothetical protein